MSRQKTHFQPARRSFLKKTAAASLGASFVIAGTKASGRVIGANDKIRVGVAGIHGRGGAHINSNMC
ncbi:MAG: gfo/Idh/MocA family oxidoreductase, partial [Planctomycetota bacterium]|nr:gfo/Idh/MocA family oxidoreductase [Planctomycetota bacterium]